MPKRGGGSGGGGSQRYNNNAGNGSGNGGSGSGGSRFSALKDYDGKLSMYSIINRFLSTHNSVLHLQMMIISVARIATSAASASKHHSFHTKVM